MMNQQTVPAPVSGEVGHIERTFYAVIAAIFAPIRRAAEIARIKHELSTYSDRELADMGIGRTDIPRIARESTRKA